MAGVVDATCRMLDDDRLPWTDWSISRVLAVELAFRLEHLKPCRVLEIGSGASTVLLAEYAASFGAEVVSLEHSRKYYERTRRSLAALGLDGRSTLHLAPLRPRHFAAEGLRPWYSTELEGLFDFIFVDGPPLRVGREAVFFAVAEHRQPGWELWLDDGLRHHERRCVDRWGQQFEFDSRLRDLDGKGLWILRDTSATRSQVEEESTFPGPLDVGVLGEGPDRVLQRLTEWWMREQSGAALTISHVAAEDDPITWDSVNRVADGFVRRRGTDDVLLLTGGAGPCTLDASWLSRAQALLRSNRKVGQVRLGHRGQPGSQGPPALDFYASLNSVAALSAVFPCASMETASTRFREAGFSVAQLSPGVFRY